MQHNRPCQAGPAGILMYDIPEELLYDRGHMWVRIEGDKAMIGLSDFIQQRLGAINFVQLPQIGATLKANRSFGVVQAAAGSRELVAPVTGEVLAVNVDLENTPDLCNQDPYGQGWIAQVQLREPAQGLLNADGYAIYCQTEND